MRLIICTFIFLYTPNIHAMYVNRIDKLAHVNDLAVGDLVESFSDKESYFDKVVKLTCHKENRVLVGTYYREIQIAANQSLRIREGLRPARDLQIGDQVYTTEGWEKVEEVRELYPDRVVKIHTHHSIFVWINGFLIAQDPKY